MKKLISIVMVAVLFAVLFVVATPMSVMAHESDVSINFTAVANQTFPVNITAWNNIIINGIVAGLATGTITVTVTDLVEIDQGFPPAFPHEGEGFHYGTWAATLDGVSYNGTIEGYNSYDPNTKRHHLWSILYDPLNDNLEACSYVVAPLIEGGSLSGGVSLITWKDSVQPCLLSLVGGYLPPLAPAHQALPVHIYEWNNTWNGAAAGFYAGPLNGAYTWVTICNRAPPNLYDQEGFAQYAYNSNWGPGLWSAYIHHVGNTTAGDPLWESNGIILGGLTGSVRAGIIATQNGTAFGQPPTNPCFGPCNEDEITIRLCSPLHTASYCGQVKVGWPFLCPIFLSHIPAPGMGAYNYTVTWDPSRVECVNVTAGPLIPPTWAFNVVGCGSGNGSVTLAGGGPAVAGPGLGGIFHIITFKCISGGPSPIAIVNCTLLDTAAALIPHADAAGRVNQVCFIATAAYGSNSDPQVETLREFRDQYLLTNPVGERLTSLYYEYSPPVADFINEHPALKPVVRAGLLPAVAMSNVATNTTSAGKIAIIGSLVLVSVTLAVWLRWRSRRIGKWQ